MHDPSSEAVAVNGAEREDGRVLRSERFPAPDAFWPLDAPVAGTQPRDAAGTAA